MGNTRHSRRGFLRRLAAAPASTNNDNDPLFKKYSRKRGGRRSYGTELVNIKPGTDDADSTARVGNVTSGLAPYTGAWTEWEVLHLLRRTTFGWKKAWVDQLLPLGPSAAVDAVLNVSATPPAPPVNWYQNIANETDENNVPYGADWTADFFPTGSVGQNTNYNRNDALRRWLFGLTLNGEVTIREKMVWFWYHFIPVDFQTVVESSNSTVNTNSARIFYRYFKMFRDNALGNFKALMKQVTLQPAMMYYLNNQANTVTAPDENYARELMELFTLGKEPLRYTEDDVKAAARALTGWRVNGLNTATVTTDMTTANNTTAHPGTRRHDKGEKLFSSYFGPNAKIAASDDPATWAGELDQLLNLIFGPAQQEAVSRYICRRLYRYFVYYDIDANVENNVIVPLAQHFVASNWNIKPVLERLFKSQHFFDAANRGVYIKSPFDFVAGTLNNFAVNTASANVEWQYRIWARYNDDYCNGMEQRMGSIPNVAGWNAFYQPPAYHQYWINSNSAQKRYAWIRDCVTAYHTVGSVYPEGQTSGALRRFSADTVAFAAQFGYAVASNPNALVAKSIMYLLPVDLSDATKQEIKVRNLLNNLPTDSYWTGLWDAYVAAPADPTKRKAVEDKLKNLYTELCQFAEYQLM